MKFFIIALTAILSLSSSAQEFERTCYCTSAGRLCFIPADSSDQYKLFHLDKKKKEWEYKGSYKKSGDRLAFLPGSHRFPNSPFRIARVKKDKLILFEEGCKRCGEVTRRRFFKCDSRMKKGLPALP